MVDATGDIAASAQRDHDTPRCGGLPLTLEVKRSGLRGETGMRSALKTIF
jgi:hypothetical protein